MADRDLAKMLALVARLEPALEQHDRAAVVDIAQQLVDLRAPLGNQWRSLAYIVADIGEFRLAREAIDLFVEMSGGDPAAGYQKAGLLAQTGAWNESYTLLRTLPRNVPDPAANAYSRGTTALYIGETAEARRELDEATRLQPRLAAAWQSLATLVDFSDEPELTERIIAAENGVAGLPPAERAVFYYALGKARADHGEHALAFAAFERGAALLKPALGYDRDHDRMSATEAVRGYSAERIEAIASRQTEPTGRTIFVTGPPRSGTTLVEQILASHSAVDDGAEINLLRLLSAEIGGLDYETLRRSVGDEGPGRPARLWRHWLDQRFPNPGRIVDKTTNTTRMLGLAATLLPEAPLIWLTRDPLDRAWSCFRTYFLGTQPWSYDLEDIAFHFRLEDRLLSQWREILGDRLLVVPFEALVAQPDSWIRRILAHCGLAEEPQVFAPHENRRAVATSSVMQVRQPINDKGIGAAEPYRTFLRPFIDAYYD